MKGIYLTTEAKQGIEAKLKQIKFNDKSDHEDNEDYLLKKFELEQDFIDNLLSSATILPIEESWDIVNEKTDYGLNYREVYPNGVIIQPKQ
jgi:hypothetical protein